jgi:hypothetical protein
MTTNTFATATLSNSTNAIADIQGQIEALQKRLTELQAHRQQILSAEQKGESAKAQYRDAIAAIAALDEPEMLREFLSEMAAITANACGDRAESYLAPADDDLDGNTTPANDPAPELDADEPNDLDPDAIAASAVNDTDPMDPSPDADLVVPEDAPDATNAIIIRPDNSDDAPLSKLSWNELRAAAKSAGVSVKGRKRPEIEADLAASTPTA